MSSDDLVAARIEALRQRDPQSEPDDYWTGWNDALDKVLALAAKPEPGLDAVLRQLETDARAADHDAIESGPDFARGIRYAIARLSAKEPTDEQR